MKKTALWLLVVVAAGCNGPKTDSGPPFLEGLTVNEATPIEVKCQGDQIIKSGTYPFSNKDKFRAAYSGLKDALENSKVYAPGTGLAYDFRYFQSCDVTQSGRSFETWTRR
jgi:hypothetical protein